MRRSDSWALDEQAREQAEAAAAAAPPGAARRASEPACSRSHASDLYVRVGAALSALHAFTDMIPYMDGFMPACCILLASS